MADQEIMGLSTKSAVSDSDFAMLFNDQEAYKALVSDVADAILNKLTSKSFSGLQTSAKNVISALNELNSKNNLQKIINNANGDGDYIQFVTTNDNVVQLQMYSDDPNKFKISVRINGMWGNAFWL